MSITTEEQLADLRENVRRAVAEADLELALELLSDALPAGRPKSRSVAVLSGRANDILDYDTNNTLPTAQLNILRNELRGDLLTFADHLVLADFTAEPVGRPELKPGHLLYRVPPVMAARKTHRCLIRIAHQLGQVLKGLTIDDSISLEEIPVAEVMEVEIIDPNPAEERAFDILLLSDGEQVVDEFTATEWVFNVRPLREGSFELVLKISVLLLVNGKERTKNIVLSRAISVETETEEALNPGLVRVLESGPAMEPHEPKAQPPASAPYDLPRTDYAAPAPSSIPEKKSQKRRLSPYLNAAAAVLLLVAATFLVWPSENREGLGGGDSPVTTTKPPDPLAVPVPVDPAPYLELISRDTTISAKGQKIIVFRGRAEDGRIITIRDTLR